MVEVTDTDFQEAPTKAKAWGWIPISYILWQKQGKQLCAFDLQVK